MTSQNTQDRDVFNDADPGIAFTEAGQTWTISNGTLVSSINSQGVFSLWNKSTLFNRGAILSDGSDAAGVELSGDDSSISNAAGARIISVATAVAVDGKTANIDNQGSILGLGFSGVDFDANSQDATLTNNGTIYGRSQGVRDFSAVDGAVIHNSGLINSDKDGIAVSTASGLTTVIDNTVGGTIRGGDLAISVTAGKITLDNHGRLAGGIEVAPDLVERDVIANHGKIRGNVSLGGGNDVFAGTGGTSGDVSGGTGNDRLVGGGSADKLYGEAGNDRLVGAAGNDWLDGGLGIDTLIGGTGRDRFIFQSDLGPSLNVDRITDFVVKADTIVLEASIFQGIGHRGELAAARFHVGAAAHDGNDHIIYNPNNGSLTYDANRNHAGGAVHFATLAPHLALTHADFFVTEILQA